MGHECRILKKDTGDKESINFIYSGLGNVSKNGREQLKYIAQSLIAMQSGPGFLIPENICREIVQEIDMAKIIVNTEKTDI